jgi:hypothetical protein
MDINLFFIIKFRDGSRNWVLTNRGSNKVMININGLFKIYIHQLVGILCY